MTRIPVRNIVPRREGLPIRKDNTDVRIKLYNRYFIAGTHRVIPRQVSGQRRDALFKARPYRPRLEFNPVNSV